MDFRKEIQNILRSKGIASGAEANRLIFSIATLGLLIGKDNLENIVFDINVMSDKKYFEGEILSLLSEDAEIEIAKMMFQFIPSLFDRKGMLTQITDIVLKFDLSHIIFDLDIFDYSVVGIKEYAITNIVWLNQLVIEILETHGKGTLYNADCGSGKFIIEAYNNELIENAIGYASNIGDYAIAKVRSYFGDDNFKIVYHDLFPSALSDEKVDMAYCSYPFMVKYDEKEVMSMIDSWDFPFVFNRKYSSNLLWIINALQSVKDDGIVVAFIPDGVLFNSIDTDIRRYLITNNYIDAIISLPNGILPWAGVSTSLLVMKKNRNQNTVKMIDATNIYNEQRRYKFFSNADVNCIVDLYVNEKNTDISFEVTFEEIAANDFYLGMNRYCNSTLVNPCVLEDVTKNIFRGYQIKAKELDEITVDDDSDSDHRIINISDIKAEGFVSKNLSKIRVNESDKFDKYCVRDGDIIITAKNTTIKSAIYRNCGDYKAILTGNLIAIRVNEKKISPYYLKAFLDSEQGQASLKSIQTGTSIITLNPNSLKNMKISLLDMQLQTTIADEYMKNLNFLEDLLEKYNEAFIYSSKIFDSVIKYSN